MLTNSNPVREACGRWNSALPTSPNEGPPGGTYDKHEAPVKPQPGERPADAFDRVRMRLLAYDIFPPRLLHFAICGSGKIELGALVVQQLGLGPMRIESAVRVIDVWDKGDADEREAGFRYVTLSGHPERGVASFLVRYAKPGQVEVVLDARSAAGTVATRLGRPVARRIQIAITRAALKRLAARG